MNINENAVLKISKNIEFQAPVERVWDLQANIDQRPKWQPEISYAKLATSLEHGKTFVWKSSGFKVSSTIGEVEKHSYIEWNSKSFDASAIHIWEFKQLENGNTLVCTQESMDGWLVKLLRGMMSKKLNDSLDTWLKALKDTAESQN